MSAPPSPHTLRQLAQLPSGQHEIEGDNVFAMVYRGVRRAREAARLGSHRKYMDIQCVLSGLDTMVWFPVSQCRQPDGDYIPERIMRFFLDEPTAWLPVHPRAFAIFLPVDAHMPSISVEPIDKVVIKVAVDWRCIPTCQ